MRKSDMNNASIHAKVTCGGALPTARDRHWLKQVVAEDIARYTKGGWGSPASHVRVSYY